MHRMSRRLLYLLIVLSTVFSSPVSGAPFFSWNEMQPALRRAAHYGYQLLGYPPPEYHDDDVHFPIVQEEIWDGHIPVADFISPLVNSMGSGYGDDRVVKGYENRLGLRLAIPYFGDFQVTRELGPGRFLDKLGPGAYKYKGIDDRPRKPSTDYGDYHHQPHHQKPHHVPHNKDMYQSLQNYPWYRRR